MQILDLDPVRFAMPTRGANAARTFYAGVIGERAAAGIVGECHTPPPGNRLELIEAGGRA